MSNYTPEIPLKKCSKCNVEKPATCENFRIRKYGFTASCKECDREYMRQRRTAMPEKEKESNRRYRAKNRDALNEYTRKFRHDNPEIAKAYRKKYYDADPEKHKARNAQWKKDNPEKAKEIANRSSRNRRVKIGEYQKQWAKRNPDKVRIATQKRLARREELPYDFTDSDWQYALKYFNGCCATCGRQLGDLFGDHYAAMDHWIPLSSPDCPGTMPKNIVPLCHGKDGCNNSKGNKDATEWLAWKFGKKNAKRIAAQIADYFSIVR